MDRQLSGSCLVYGSCSELTVKSSGCVELAGTMWCLSIRGGWVFICSLFEVEWNVKGKVKCILTLHLACCMCYFLKNARTSHSKYFWHSEEVLLIWRAGEKSKWGFSTRKITDSVERKEKSIFIKLHHIAHIQKRWNIWLSLKTWSVTSRFRACALVNV